MIVYIGHMEQTARKFCSSKISSQDCGASSGQVLVLHVKVFSESALRTMLISLKPGKSN